MTLSSKSQAQGRKSAIGLKGKKTQEKGSVKGKKAVSTTIVKKKSLNKPSCTTKEE